MLQTSWKVASVLLLGVVEPHGALHKDSTPCEMQALHSFWMEYCNHSTLLFLDGLELAMRSGVIGVMAILCYTTNCITVLYLGTDCAVSGRFGVTEG